MGRKRIYEPSTTKTSTAQKAAINAYRERQKGTPNEQKTIGITMTAAEVDADRATLAAHGLTVKEFWRQSMEQLRNTTNGTPAAPTDTTKTT